MTIPSNSEHLRTPPPPPPPPPIPASLLTGRRCPQRARATTHAVHSSLLTEGGGGGGGGQEKGIGLAASDCSYHTDSAFTGHHSSSVTGVLIIVLTTTCTQTDFFTFPYPLVVPFVGDTRRLFLLQSIPPSSFCKPHPLSTDSLVLLLQSKLHPLSTDSFVLLTSSYSVRPGITNLVDGVTPARLYTGV